VSRRGRQPVGIGPIIFIILMVIAIVYLYATGSFGTH
jgi:hypothetical protein